MIVWMSLAWAATLDGAVRVLGSGDPIPMVTIELPDGTLVAQSDAEGRFQLDVAPGTPLVFLSPAHMRKEATAPESGPWIVFLEPAPSDLEVVVEARRDDPVVSQQKLDRERVLKTPGTFEDPVRLVQSLPGVTMTPEYGPSAGDIAVRGSAPGENRFYLDGIELPYLYHFNDYASVFHTRLLDELTLYPSTYNSTWGDTTGAIVDTHSVWDQPEALHGTVNFNLVMSGGSVAVPLSDTWSIRASGRRSYLDFASNDSEQYTVFPVFWDYFSRIEHHPSEKARYGLVFFGAGDHYSRRAGEPTLLDPYEQLLNPSFDYRQSFHIGALQQQWAGVPGKLESSLSYTRHMLGGTLPDAQESIQTDRVTLRADALGNLGHSQQLAVGTELRQSFISASSTTARPWPEVSYETRLLSYGLSGSDALVRFTGGVYGEGRLTAGRLRVSPGLRVDYDSITALPALDPRINLRFEAGPDTRLRLAAGRYSAFPDDLYLMDAFFTLDDPRPAHSDQLAFGFDHAFAGRLEIGVDTYAAWAKNLLYVFPDGAIADGVVGRSMGVEINSRYRLRDRFFMWLSVSLMDAVRLVDGVTQTFAYDQPYASSFVLSWDFLPGWNTGLRYRLAAGLPYTPISDGIYDATTDSYRPVYGAAYSARLPLYQKIDAHLEKRWDFQRWNLTAYTEAWYVPPPNTMYLAWSYDYDVVESVHGPSFVPLVGLRAEY